MKTIKFPKIFALVALAALFTVSCSKNTDSSFFSIASPDPTGSIFDLGSLENGVRVMKTSLSTQSLNVTDVNGEALGTSTQVDVTFLVDGDGNIPSGEYHYASAESFSPFTFHSAFFTAASLNDGTSSIYGDIVLGTITVTNAGNNNYRFEFQGQVDSGNTLTGSCDCTMSYQDML